MHAQNSTCIQKSRLTGNIHSLGKYKLICSLSHVFCQLHQKLWKSSLHLLFTLLFAILGWETICYLSRHARCQNKNGTADFNITKKYANPEHSTAVQHLVEWNLVCAYSEGLVLHDHDDVDLNLISVSFICY